MVSSGVEDVDEHYFAETNRNKPSWQTCHGCIQGLNACKVRLHACCVFFAHTPRPQSRELSVMDGAARLDGWCQNQVLLGNTVFCLLSFNENNLWPLQIPCSMLNTWQASVSFPTAPNARLAKKLTLFLFMRTSCAIETFISALHNVHIIYSWCGNQ